jgi:DNA-damage-inducible protein J
MTKTAQSGLPFPVEIPNDETLKVFKESEEGKGLVECKDADDMLKRLRGCGGTRA